MPLLVTLAVCGAVHRRAIRLTDGVAVHANSQNCQRLMQRRSDQLTRFCGAGPVITGRHRREALTAVKNGAIVEAAARSAIGRNGDLRLAMGRDGKKRERVIRQVGGHGGRKHCLQSAGHLSDDRQLGRSSRRGLAT